MASDTASERNDESDLALSWSGRWTLTHRILAVNILTLVLIALGIFYLDAYPQPARARNACGRLEPRRRSPPGARRVRRPARDGRIARRDRAQATGTPVAALRLPTARWSLDSWRLDRPDLHACATRRRRRWTKDVARALDRGFNALVGARSLEDFIEPAVDRPAPGPRARDALRRGEPVTAVRNAPDLTPVILRRRAAGDRGDPAGHRQRSRLHPHRAQPARRAGHRARGVATLLSILLSLFLARTIVRPLRRLAIAAHRVRLGRAREVKVPRLPSRQRRDRPARALGLAT